MSHLRNFGLALAFIYIGWWINLGLIVGHLVQTVMDLAMYSVLTLTTEELGWMAIGLVVILTLTHSNHSTSITLRD